MQIYSSSQENQGEMSHNESIVRAMVENAKSSSLRENLENAAMAQKNFMLVPVDQSGPDGNEDRKFLQRIAKRSEEMRSKDKSD